MATVNFDEWAQPSLDLTINGHDYAVVPPSVPVSRTLRALACVSERSLGLAAGVLSEDILEAAREATGPLGEIALGRRVHDAMLADGVPSIVIDRASVYAMHYWTSGRAFADTLATALWGIPAATAGDASEVTA